MAGNFDNVSFDIGIGGFDGDSTADTHDGDPWYQRTYRGEEEDFSKKRESAQRLREQIRLALEGPQAPILEPALELVAEPGPEPIEARVDIGELVSQVELWKAVREAAQARARDIDDDDEIVLLLT